LLVDVGSTFTKVTVVEPDGRLAAHAHARTTIEHDVMLGVCDAVSSLPGGGDFDWALLCSSAAGGLRMASVGLTRALSGQAGTFAALGAGAKVVATEAGYLDDDGLGRIAEARVHLVLLSGGLDGGNEDALVHNARALAALEPLPGVIVAGNVNVSSRAASALAGSGRDVRVVDNVFPRPGEIAVAPTREAVRDLFLQHITKAKGLDGLMAHLQSDCEPTPLAVSRSLWDLPGRGSAPVVLVDVGGATTDVHSVGGWQSRHRSVDLPLPDVLRTVEGDLGMRWGAPGVVEAAGEGLLRALADRAGTVLEPGARLRHNDAGLLPQNDADRRVDRALATGAIAIAVERHAGRVVVRHRPWGDRYRVEGKDLRRTQLLLATGGVFRYVADPVEVIRDALGLVDGAFVPKDPRIVIDWNYSMYAIGLIARLDRDLARSMADGVVNTAA
jgi:uncharacterized protein (TIGR01319 family)